MSNNELHNVAINAAMLEAVLAQESATIAATSASISGLQFDVWARLRLAVNKSGIVVFDLQHDAMRRVPVAEFDGETMSLAAQCHILAVGRVSVKDAGAMDFTRNARKRLETLYVTFVGAERVARIFSATKRDGIERFTIVNPDEIHVSPSKLSKVWKRHIVYINSIGKNSVGTITAPLNDWNRFNECRDTGLANLSANDQKWYDGLSRTLNYAYSVENVKHAQGSTGYIMKALRF